MDIQLYNTLTRQKEAFRPLDPQRVTMYVCGPTVYNYAHIGNARPAVVFDTLYRLLQRSFPKVIYARNVTDVDDKINQSAKDQGVPISAITERYLAAYHADMGALGVLPPTIEPKVTQHIDAIIAMIERLIVNGNAYEKDGQVLFHVPSFKEYGQLSRRDRDDMIAGARVDVAAYKKDPADFTLWKPSTPDMVGWDSPWGRGRPGWHIECSAMIERNFGIGPIDIHGGGHDLIFPHHENEIAQSTCANNGALFCRTWLHNGFVNINAEKMSKSLGNVTLVHDLIELAPGEALRLVLLSAHYRQPLDWTENAVKDARAQLDRLYRALDSLKDVEAGIGRAPDNFMAALADDLNTPRALAELHQIANAANKATGPGERTRLKSELLASGWLLGLLQQDPAAWLKGTGVADVDAVAIEALIADRKAARARKDWAESDRIRDELAAKGILLEDKAGETTMAGWHHERSRYQGRAGRDRRRLRHVRRLDGPLSLPDRSGACPARLSRRSAHRCVACEGLHQPRLAAWRSARRPVYYQASSESEIVAGLIALLLKVYSGRTPQEIVDNPPDFLQRIGVWENITSNRINGLNGMIALIQSVAKAELKAA